MDLRFTYAPMRKYWLANSLERLAAACFYGYASLVPILILLLTIPVFPNDVESRDRPASKTSFGISLQPYKYKMAADGDMPFAQADLLFRKGGDWYFGKFSWIGLYKEASCSGCTHTPNIDEIRFIRMGVSKRYLRKEIGFSPYFEPGINVIRWYYRNSEFLRLDENLNYEEDREELGFMGVQPIAYGGMQWHYGYFLASFSLGIGLNLGVHTYKMTGRLRESEAISTPISLPDYKHVSGDVNFGIGVAF